MFEIKLLPADKLIAAESGSALRDLLFPHGVEFVCGGKGCCKGCRVKVTEGAWLANEREKRALGEDSLAQGWRLACQGKVDAPLTIEIAQWEAPVLSDSSRSDFTPGEGLGIAVDLGTTTIAVQLLDLESGEVLAVASGLNAQAVHGADVMTRLEYALQGGAENLQRKVRRQLGDFIDHLVLSVPLNRRKLRKVVIAGNTVMHHFFSGLPIESLAEHPFEPASAEPQHFTSDSLGWSWRRAEVEFLPCLGGLVGSDILAGIVATGLHESEEPVALIDLGTNGEIVVGNKQRILCASTAAGPAFEGARISMGMRAATGAISEVAWHGGQIECRVIGGAQPRGLCGSGLVDAVSVGLDQRIILPNGRFAEALPTWPLAGRVNLAQRDVRELQLAKSAVATGLVILCREFGTQLEDLEKVYLAGAFGNYVNAASARKIGLLPIDLAKIVPAGNTALRGTKRALFKDGERHIGQILSVTEHVALNEHPDFQNVFVEKLSF